MADTIPLKHAEEILRAEAELLSIVQQGLIRSREEGLPRFLVDRMMPPGAVVLCVSEDVLERVVALSKGAQQVFCEGVAETALAKAAQR